MTQKTLRFRKPRNLADSLGQIFTPPAIARLLALSLPKNSKKIIDVGAGSGALTQGALTWCKNASVFLIEKDIQQINILRNNLTGKSTVVEADALFPGVIEKCIGKTVSPVLISNPPYNMIRQSNKFIDSKSSLHPVIDGAGWMRGDAAFVSRIWDASNLGASIGLIVASPIICGNSFLNFRKTLIDGLSNLIITELHPRTFPGVEVRAFIISGTRALNRRRNVMLRLADIDGSIIDEFSISYMQALSRLDYRYHSTAKDFSLSSDQVIGTLLSLDTSISRGSKSHKVFKSLGHQAFHTTDFAKTGEFLALKGAAAGFNHAQVGDILIPRVGSRCLLREAKVIEGKGLITDCVYRIRALEKYRVNIWNTINSDFGRAWRDRFSEGSCAKYLTISSINSLPILR